MPQNGNSYFPTSQKNLKVTEIFQNLIIFGAVPTNGFAMFRIEDQNIIVTCDLLAKECTQVVDNRSNSKFQMSCFRLMQQSHSKTGDCYTSCTLSVL